MWCVSPCGVCVCDESVCGVYVWCGVCVTSLCVVCMYGVCVCDESVCGV